MRTHLEQREHFVLRRKYLGDLGWQVARLSQRIRTDNFSDIVLYSLLINLLVSVSFIWELAGIKKKQSLLKLL